MLSFFKDWYMKNLSNPAAIILILQFITIFVILYFFSSIFGTLIAALVLAFMLERPVNFLIKHGASRLGATTLVMLCYVVFFVCLFVTVIPPAAEQLTKISTNISETLTEISKHGENANIKEILKEKIVLSPQADSQTEAAPENEASSGEETSAEDTADTDLTAENSDTPAADEGAGSSDAQQQQAAADAADSTSGAESENGKQLTVTARAEPAADDKADASAEEHKGYEPQQINQEDREESNATIAWISAKVQSISSKLPNAYKELISEKQMKEYTISLFKIVKGWVAPFITNNIAPLVMDMLSFVIYFLIVPIFAFYMLKDKEKLLSVSKKYLCSHEEVTSFWAEMNVLISKYLNGKCIHVIIIFIVNWIAFSILNLNYGLLLAIGVGLSVIIPYVGMIIITIPIAIIGLIQFGLSSDMVWLVAVYTVIQILDGYVLTPMLFSEKLNLDPFSILVAIVVFGGLLGFWGVVLAIPLATFVKTIFTKWPVNHEYLESIKNKT
ncbi:AI-2E family transporter [Ruminobacter sp.]|uniref:AI-2E family transporter n=1 Tax=Ruminobacter sp. TaxID=2774296 RepID=UPI0038652146